MGLVFAWTGTFMSLAAVGWAVLGGVRLYQKFAGTRSSEPVPEEPIELLGANLCRLHSKLEAEENEMFLTPFKAARLRALRGAYVDVLSTACERLGVPPPVTPSHTAVPLAEIYRAEAALRERGLDVRRQIPV
ncbi:MAG: hypothetical protein JO345_26865 [Streptosporangiaceae bacterium]|nr:hypothetical protein [Streptosporangiaceae bacterium]